MYSHRCLPPQMSNRIKCVVTDALHHKCQTELDVQPQIPLPQMSNRTRCVATYALHHKCQTFNRRDNSVLDIWTKIQSWTQYWFLTLLILLQSTQCVTNYSTNRIPAQYLQAQKTVCCKDMNNLNERQVYNYKTGAYTVQTSKTG